MVFGGGKDIRFYQELSDLIGSTTHTETRYSSRGREWFGVMDRSFDQRRVPILEPAELRRIEQRKALVLAEMYDPIISSLHRCIDGKRGKELLAAQKRARLTARGDDETPHPTQPNGCRTHGADRDDLPDPAAARDSEVEPGATDDNP
ncbi:MAG: TraM recognition domain-containing protein [Nocardioides sp.]|uniref:TraM recognition domain-containing protein n=1 Tax=Nocardioides sp. TaxID=35761 RepID=UPI00326540A2